ncbi:MAG TPA: metallophosphoesterase [Planctomycetota bacterium]
MTSRFRALLPFLFLALPLVVLSIVGILGNREARTVVLGAIADCQYADQPDGGQRLYRRSPDKLRAAVADLNGRDLDLVLHLGDFIDKDWASFDVVAPIYDQLKAPHHHVLGNHDFSVEDARKPEVPARLGLKSRYYALREGSWRFLALDSNDLSTYAWPAGSAELEASLAWYAEHGNGAAQWNGAVGPEQLAWLEAQLVEAAAAGDRVVVSSHHPVYPDAGHNLWNAAAVRELLLRYPCVKLYLSGHNHNGDYAEIDGLHFLTLHGMVDTEATSYAVLTLGMEWIEVDGVGRTPDRRLTIR